MRLIGIGTTPNQVYHRRETAGSDRHMANAFFSDLLSTISERGRTLLRRGGALGTRENASELLELCEALLFRRRETSGTPLAPRGVGRFPDLSPARPASVLRALAPRS